MFSTRSVLVGLVLLTIVALIAMSFKSQENFESDESAGADAADAMVFQVYMDIYGVPPPERVTQLYAAMIRESGLDEGSLKVLIESDLDAAPGAVAIEEEETDMMNEMPMTDGSEMPADMTEDGDGMEHYEAGGAFKDAMIEFGPGNRVVDCAGGTCGSGTDLHIWDPAGTDNQKWTYDPTSQTMKGMGHCMDVANSGKDNGAKVWSYACNNGPAQKWVVQKNRGPGQGAVQLMNPNSGKCLDVDGAVDVQGTKLQLWDCSGSGHAFDIREQGPPGWTKINGKARQVSLSDSYAVVTNSSDEIFVSKLGSGEWTKTDGLLRHVAIGDRTRICGVTKDQDVFMAGNPADTATTKMNWILKKGKLKQISLSNDMWGGVNDGGAIYIAKANIDDWKRLPGIGKYLSMDGGRACHIGVGAIPGGYEIWCADDVTNPKWEKMVGGAVMVELSGDNLVCVNSAGELFHGKYKTGNWQKIGDGFIHADISGNMIYAITKANDIMIYRIPTTTASAPVVVKPTEGQSVKCSKNSPVAGGVFRYEGGKLRHYPSPPIANSWDPNWGKPLAIDCTDVPSGPAMAMKGATASPTPQVAAPPPPVVVKPTEGQAVYCTKNSPIANGIFRYEGGKLRHYPNAPIANSWDPNWGKRISIDCTGLPAGPAMAMKGATASTPQVAAPPPPVAAKPTEGQAVYCTKNSPIANGIFRYEGGKLRHYPNAPIANSWDPNWGKKISIDCTGIPAGPAMAMKGATASTPQVAAPPPPVAAKPTEGQAVYCTKNSPIANGIFRYEGGKLRHYPNAPIANSWDPNWGKKISIDCTGIPAGPAMAMKGAATPVIAPPPVVAVPSVPAKTTLVAAPALKIVLGMSETLVSGTATDRLQSGLSSLVMQGDGNLVLYNGKTPVWASQTMGKGTGPYRAAMQSDGNFVVYDIKNTPTWATGTNRGAGKYAVALQGAKFVVLNSNAIVWASDAPKPPPVTVVAKPPAKPVAKPPAKAVAKAPAKAVAKAPARKPTAKQSARGVRTKDTCSCNVNVTSPSACNSNGECPMCNKRIASPRSALKALQHKAWELSANPSVVVPARSDQGSIGIRLQTLADQVASLSTEYNGLPEGGSTPIGFESFINF